MAPETPSRPGDHASNSPEPAAEPRRALITGISGQDGSFLAEQLLDEGYRVSGLSHGGPDASLGASEHLRSRLELIAGELLDPASLRAALVRARPHELYHLAAPSFVPDSWKRPAWTLAAIAGASTVLLEAVRELDPTIRVFVASSGAMFGAAAESPQHEGTCCRPDTPYAVAKLAMHQQVAALRTHDGLYACSGILYNHESERRPERFVTRKITRAAAAVKLGLTREVVLGDLGAVRDWSFAGDIVRGMRLMLRRERPDDYILASGRPHTVGELADAAFACVELEAERYVRVDPALVRALETTPLVGDPAKARNELGWQAQLSFEELVERMVRADLQRLRAGAR